MNTFRICARLRLFAPDLRLFAPVLRVPLGPKFNNFSKLDFFLKTAHLP